MLYLDKTTVANSRHHKRWFDEVKAQRGHANAMERQMFGNAAALIPDDSWRAVDTGTRSVFRDDDGEVLLADLMPLAAPVNIGKMSVVSRVSSTAGKVSRSLTGLTPTTTDKAEYDYRSAIIPLFSTSYSRPWREVAGMQSEGFDGLADDDRETKITLRSNMASYLLDGDSSLVFDGVAGAGIRTSPYSKAIDIGATGANIDLTSATGDAFMSFLEGAFSTALVANKIVGGVTMVVSPEIAQNLDKTDTTVLVQPTTGIWTPGTIGARVENFRRIEKIIECSLLSGNEFVAYKRAPEFIRPRIGMAATTIPKVRANMFDDHEFISVAALGLQIGNDFNGNSGVFYSTT